MTFEAEFLELMPYTVQLQHKTGRDNYGNKVLGAATSYRARVSYDPVRIVTITGEEVVASGTVWIAGTVSPALAPTDIITLPDGTVRDLIRASVVADETGEHHTVCYF